jgi:FkbH-like protein
MSAEIGSFRPVYLERITQLINKTNQFNLTTRRYTSGEVEAIAQDPAFLTLYGRLTDKFGDNGLVSVMVGQVVDEILQLDLWLMSCRVLKREMEFAMFDALVEQCQLRGVRKIVGVYIRSKKNGMVAGHYASLGFSAMNGTSESGELWGYDVPSTYSPRARYIRRTAEPLQPAAIADSASVPSEV